jgi:hypothetical protein
MSFQDVLRHRRGFLQDLRNHHYEVTEGGLLVFPRHGLCIGGAFTHEVHRQGESLGIATDDNIVVTEGLNYILNSALHDDPKVGTWYCSLFATNSSPVAGLTAADYNATLNEITEYDETTRPAYVEAAAAGGIITNSASKAQFTINATVNNWGAALLSDSAKESAAAGQKLLAAVKYAAVRALQAGDILSLQYSLTATST